MRAATEPAQSEILILSWRNNSGLRLAVYFLAVKHSQCQSSRNSRGNRSTVNCLQSYETPPARHSHRVELSGAARIAPRSSFALQKSWSVVLPCAIKSRPVSFI